MNVEKEEARIIHAALAWWKLQRPEGWTESEHIKNPTINCNGSEEDALGRACAVFRLKEIRQARR